VFGLLTVLWDREGRSTAERPLQGLDLRVMRALHGAEGGGTCRRGLDGLLRRHPRVIAGATAGVLDARAMAGGVSGSGRLHREFAASHPMSPRDTH